MNGAQIKSLIESGKFDAARQAVKSSASPKSAAMLERINLEEAKSLMKNQQYKQARALLITSAHPDAEMLLSRVNAADQSTALSGESPSFTVKLFITIVLLLFALIPGLIALAIFAPEAKRYPDAPGAKSLILINRFIFWIIVAGLVVFLIFAALTWIGLPK